MARTAAYVACNIYVSAGRPGRSVVLLDALSKAQARCRVLRQDEGGQKVALVHAFADAPYDRSSFHLAGSSELVSDVASQIATQALLELSEKKNASAPAGDCSGDDDEGKSNHPFVGIVDHISVMPLRSASMQGGNDHEGGKDTGQAAKAIGQALSKVGAKVYYYGHADPNTTPLATVRRERTAFFKSGDAFANTKSEEDESSIYGTCTVGAPANFVENFNVRLSQQCSKEVAKTLTKKLRERDGGIVGVEALTLPYSENRFEVACNLLQPSQGTSSMVEASALEWARANGGERMIDEAYRVGTTEEQCVEVLSLQGDGIDEHDRQVRQNFAKFLATSIN